MNTKLMFSSKSREWRTPPEFYRKLNQEFHFTLDPCCTKESALSQKKILHTRRSWTEARLAMGKGIRKSFLRLGKHRCRRHFRVWLLFSEQGIDFYPTLLLFEDLFSPSSFTSIEGKRFLSLNDVMVSSFG